jgi:hypothetical protein
MRTIVAASLLFVAAPAAADPSVFAFGARVGGYGFRHDNSNDWNECRMNGMGVFGERRFGGHAFVETGLDLYFTQSFPMATQRTDAPIDRTSGLFTAAIGMRASGPWRTDGYAQVGAGLELTRVSVPYQDSRISDQMALPEGFIGVGGDIKIGDKTYLGANLRAHVMGNFNYDPKQLQMQPGWTSPPAASTVFDPSPQVAAQGQFYVRRDL